MTAEIVSVGTEMLLGEILDTHAPHMARILADCGIACLRRQTVGDNLQRLTDSLRQAFDRADIVITIGGLGPTQDDITREGLSSALGAEMEVDVAYEAHLRKIFDKRRLQWVASNARQAMKPIGGRFLDNPNGTAPGLILEKDGKVAIALPGPRNEFVPMAEGPVRSYLESVQTDQVIHSRILRVCGLGESWVEEQIECVLQGDNPTVAPYAHPAEVHLRLTARAPSRKDADALIDPVDSEIRNRLGDAVYGVDATTLESAVVEMLTDAKKTVAVAESITGGGLGDRFTRVNGSGEVFLGGIITYDLRVKEKILGVSKDTLEKFGPVSKETAQEMAMKVRQLLHADFGISLTGNAGPTADVDGKPVGLVYIGLAKEGSVEVREHQLRGSRDDIRYRCTQLALVQLRESLLERSRIAQK